MVEKFDVTKTYDQYTSLEKAMEETTVLAAGKEAKRRAALVNESNADVIRNNDAFDENTREMDDVVRYLINSPATISGMVQLTPDGDESSFQFVDEVDLDFQGFVISRRQGELYYDYLFNGVIDESKRVLSATEIAERSGVPESNLQRVRIQAKVDEVFMHFSEKMHGIRAAAILQTLYPDVMHELDQWLIGKGTLTDEQKVFLSGNFEMPGRQFADEEERATFVQAVRLYINLLLDLDTEVPYQVTVEDEYLDVSSGMKNAIKKRLDATSYFTVAYVDIFDATYDENSPGDHPKGTFMNVGVFGVLHADDPQHKGTYAMLPTSNIRGFEPLRTRT